VTARLMIIGLDCLGPEVLEPRSLARLPNLARLHERGVSGPLRSSIPPITVPAWTCMFTGRDPGELGLYGFRNRIKPSYDGMRHSDGRDVLHQRLWDYVTAAGDQSIVVGVPQTYPPPHLNGVLIAGFDATAELSSAVRPPALAERVRRLVGEYAFDIAEFRHAPRDRLVRQIADMTRARFAVMRDLVAREAWRLAIFCEIGPDRIHHCFWRDHDPTHPSHDPATPYRTVIEDYYAQLDREIGDLLEAVDPDDHVMVVSDHGAKSMIGGICINQYLIESGWLSLKQTPSQIAPLDPELVDWSRTRAWAYGGYYARVFLNQKGRESQGVVAPEDREATLAELTKLLTTIALDDGRVVHNSVLQPDRIYRKARGLPPDLLVFFDDLSVRSLGSIGHDAIWATGNDTGVDHANHSWDGMYIFCGPDAPSGVSAPASIYDVLPTALRVLGLISPPDLPGRIWACGAQHDVRHLHTTSVILTEEANHAAPP
jgi:predicted AlkP superfamily phosphohydrolase/phosphomutase